MVLVLIELLQLLFNSSELYRTIDSARVVQISDFTVDTKGNPFLIVCVTSFVCLFLIRI